MSYGHKLASDNSGMIKISLHLRSHPYELPIEDETVQYRFVNAFINRLVRIIECLLGRHGLGQKLNHTGDYHLRCAMSWMSFMVVVDNS